jgi:hypothetical protein
MKYLVLLAALAAATPLRAQSNEGTPAERAACRADAFRWCNPGIPDLIDHSRVIKCLAANKQKLSKPCRAVLAAHHL